MAEIPMDGTDIQLSIKEQFRLLVVANKGPTACERILGFPQSHISEAMSRNRLDRMPRADHIAILEAACGQAIVTSFLADLLGFDLTTRHCRATGDLPHVFAAAMKEMTDVQVSYVNAVANQEIDAKERAELVKQAQEAIASLQDFVLKVDGGQ